MRYFWSLFAVLVLISTCLCFTASAESNDVMVASAVESETFVYPSWDSYQKMKKALPEKYDSHMICFDENGKVRLLTWTTDDTMVQVDPNDTSLKVFGSDGLSGKGQLHSYSWNNKTYRWVHSTTYNGAHLGSTLSWKQDYLIYTDVDLPYTNVGKYASADDLIGIDSPTWLSLTWENTFRDLPNNMIKEIIGILPVLIVVLISFMAIRKGVYFIFSVVRGS